jgi:hypothetical protein
MRDGRIHREREAHFRGVVHIPTQVLGFVDRPCKDIYDPCALSETVIAPEHPFRLVSVVDVAKQLSAFSRRGTQWLSRKQNQLAGTCLMTL